MWGLEGTVLLDETGEYARSLGVRGVPTNLVVDADGTVRAFGVSRLDELRQAIGSMLQR
jgi:protein-disulfide isomerase